MQAVTLPSWHTAREDAALEPSSCRAEPWQRQEQHAAVSSGCLPAAVLLVQAD